MAHNIHYKNLVEDIKMFALNPDGSILTKKELKDVGEEILERLEAGEKWPKYAKLLALLHAALFLRCPDEVLKCGEMQQAHGKIEGLGFWNQDYNLPLQGCFTNGKYMVGNPNKKLPAMQAHTFTTTPRMNESLKDYSKQLKKELMEHHKKITEMEKAREGSMDEVLGNPRTFKHFEWLVLYQVKRKTLGEIVEFEKERGNFPLPSTIGNEINRLANILGVELHSSNKKAGRPRGSTSS